MKEPTKEVVDKIKSFYGGEISNDLNIEELKSSLLVFTNSFNFNIQNAGNSAQIIKEASDNVANSIADAMQLYPTPNSGNLTRAQINALNAAHFDVMNKILTVVYNLKGFENINTAEFQNNPANSKFFDALQALFKDVVPAEIDVSANREYFTNPKRIDEITEIYRQAAVISNRQG